MKTRNALTLIELIIVLCVMVALSGILIPICNNQLSSATETATRATLTEVQRALQDYWRDTKLITLDGMTTFANETDRFKIVWLFKNPVTNDSTSQFNPNSRSGWNGPYIVAATKTSTSTLELIDAWNNTLQVQYVNPNDSVKDVRIVSPGPNGIIDISPSTATSLLTSNGIGDDLYVSLSLR
ncbi:MAG: type II secretion system protein [Pirellulales bacterium]